MPDPPTPPNISAQTDTADVAALKRDTTLLGLRVAQLEQTKKLVDALTPALPEYQGYAHACGRTTRKPAPRPSSELLNEITQAKQGRTDTDTTVLVAAHAGLTSLTTELDERRDSLAKPDTVSGITPLADLLRAEALDTVAANAFVLWLKISGAGGSSEVRQAGAFQRAGKRRYSGGVMVEFLLFNSSHAIVDGGVLSLYSGLVAVIEGEHAVDLVDGGVP